MKSILYLVITIILLGFTYTSCSFSSNQDKSLEVHKVVSEEIYDYYSVHDDSLVVGISGISKDMFIFKDGTRAYSLRFSIYGYPFENDIVSGYKCLILDMDDIKRLEEFLDSCITGELSSYGEEWLLKVRDDIYFEYNYYEQSLCISFNPGCLSNLRMKPEELKEILEKAKAD